MNDARALRLPHPVVWTILYIPFGALGGFVSVALTFLATEHGLSITEGAWIVGSQMLVSWLKWLWAPAVDVSLSPKRWYVISTVFSAVGVFAMSGIPLGKGALAILLVTIALANVINTVVGMAVEAMIASITPADQVGRVSAWFQAGNLGGSGVGGALGLFLIQHLPRPWMSGAIMGVLFLACCLALLPLPAVPSHAGHVRPAPAVRLVARGFWNMIKGRAGMMTAILCVLPLATGAAQGTLTQSAVAGFWGAGAREVELVQGLLAGVITCVGCFMGGYFCQRMNARTAYAVFGIVLALIAAGMAASPNTVSMYVAWNLVYSLGVGLAWAAFTAMVLVAIRRSAAATGYNVFASLANFPAWWLGLLLGWTADHHGPRMMLLTEAGLGVVGVVVFLAIDRLMAREVKEQEVVVAN